jgi:hypothetical protein
VASCSVPSFGCFDSLRLHFYRIQSFCLILFDFGGIWQRVRDVLNEHRMVGPGELFQSFLGEAGEERIACMDVNQSARNTHVLLRLAEHAVIDEIQSLQSNNLSLAAQQTCQNRCRCSRLQLQESPGKRP